MPQKKHKSLDQRNFHQDVAETDGYEVQQWHEMLIQRFVLFLGHPTYALTVVVFLMLLSSGAGSFVSRKWLKQTSSVRVPLLAIAVAIVAYVYILPIALSSLIGLEFGLKLLISAA